MIDEALEDLKRDPREKRDTVLKRLIDFYHWLKQSTPGGQEAEVNGLSTRNLDREVTELASENQGLKTELEDTKEKLKKIKLTWTKLRVGLKGWRRSFLRLRILKKNCKLLGAEI